MFRYEKHDGTQKRTIPHCFCHLFLLQVTNVLGNGPCRGRRKVGGTVAPDWMDSTHTSQRTWGCFPVSQTELLPVVSETAQKTQKEYWKSSKKCKKWNVLFLLWGFFFFFAKILNAAQTHKSKRLTRSPNTLVQLKPYSLLQSKFSITFQSSQEDHRNSCIKFINSILVRQWELY